MFKELEEEIITDSRYIYNENKIMSKPIWAKFLNYFIKNDLLLIGSIITKFIQIILNNQFIKKNIFTKIFKHEPYDEKINNTYGY